MFCHKGLDLLVGSKRPSALVNKEKLAGTVRGLIPDQHTEARESCNLSESYGSCVLYQRKCVDSLLQ